MNFTNIILTGMRGSGKTAIGQALARALNRPFMDLDHEIEKTTGEKIKFIVEQYGWEYFRALEKKIAKKAAEKKNYVIATGGGTLIDPENAKLFTDTHGVQRSAYKNYSRNEYHSQNLIVFLHCPIQTIQKRIAKNKNRPSLTGKNDFLSELPKIWEERKPIYEKLADLTIETSKKSITENVSELVKKIIATQKITDRIAFLVIGSGIAGLNFALNAAKKGKVLIVTKKRAAETSTNRAQGGIAAVLDKTDNIAQHIEDTLKAGSYHNDRQAVAFMVKHSKKAVEQLIEQGVPFATTAKGKLLLAQEGGHCTRRIAFVGDYTGKEIEKVLVKKAKSHPNITMYEHTLAIKLLIKSNTCFGAQILGKNGVKNIFADTTVLATGGPGQVYRYTTNPKISTGDGLKLADEAGCAMKDLEFIQFHPTALNLSGKPPFLISEAVRGEGAYLVNHEKKRFMERYHPQKELAPRDVVALAIYQEGKKGQVYLDITHKNAEEVKLRFPQIYQKLKKYGLDMTREPIPISPAAHYACGGIQVNLKGETGIKNLYAFGEVACTGVHGANRLASNSLLEALVFSNEILKNINVIPDSTHGAKRSAPSLQSDDKAISRHAYRQAGSDRPTASDQESRLTTQNDNFPLAKTIKLSFVKKKQLKKIIKTVQHLMWEKVGIVRSQKGLKEALEKLNALKKELPSQAYASPLLHRTRSIVSAARLITIAAIKRKQSLGSHVLGK